MPSTLTGVALFVVLLTPGFIFLQRREQFHSGVTYTTLRETSLVLVASLASLLTSLAFLAPVRLLIPAHTPDVGGYVRQFDRQIKAHYVEAAAWSLAILVLASTLAFLAAAPPLWVEKVVRRTGRNAAADWIHGWRGTSRIDSVSGWAKAKSLYPDHEQWVDVMLTDGSFVHGRLFSANPQLDETSDRDLLISSPVSARRPNGELVAMPDWGLVAINASKINYIAWKYVPAVSHGAAEGPPPSSAEGTIARKG